MKNWIIGLLAIGLMGAGIVMVGCGQSTDTSTTTTTIPSLSISGTVNFATTSDGIKGGVDIMVTASPTVIATTSADSSTGTFEVSDLEPGTYTLIASKDGWTIANTVVTLESSDLADQDFTANPTDWDVSFISGNPDLNKVASEEAGDIVIIGKGAGASYYISTDGGSTWTSGQATTAADSMLDVFLPLSDYIYLFYNSGYIRHSNDNGSSWNVMGPLIIDTPSVYIKDHSSISSATAEVVGTNGKLYHTGDSTASWSESGDDVAGFNAVTAWTDPSDKVRKLAVGEAGRVRYYDGSSWNVTDCPAPMDFLDVDRGSWDGALRYSTMVAVSSGSDTQGYICGILPGATVGALFLQGVPYSLNGVWAPGTASETNHAGVIVVGDNGVVLTGK